MKCDWAWTAALLLAAAGCGKKTAPPTEGAPASAPAPAASAAPAPAASAPTPVADAPAPAECRALARKKLVAIASRAGKAADIAVRDGDVFALFYKELGARIEVVRVPRSGGKVTVLAPFTQNVHPGGLVVGEDAAFYSVNGRLMREPFDGTKTVEIANGLSKGIAVRESDVFAVRCPTRGEQELVRLPVTGGEPSVVATFEGPKAEKCNVSSLALDGDAAYVADWATRRVLRVSMRDKKATELASQQPFPKQIALGDSDVVFQASGGLVSVPKSGGTVKKLASIGSSPDHSVAWDDHDFFIVNEDAYSMKASLERMPRAGGDSTVIEWFPVKTVPEGSGVTDVAVDDQCVYVSRWNSALGYSEILARPKS
jgi:hypothetical protein